MELSPISEFSFLIFILPGFLAVLGFYYSIDSKPEGEFKLVGLSFFWGFIVLMFWNLFGKTLPLTTSSEIYFAALVLSSFGFLVGFSIGKFSLFPPLQKLTKKLKSNWWSK